MIRNKKVKVPGGGTIDAQQMANAAAAVERIATHNKLMLEHEPFNTTCGDILSLVALAKAHWYQQSGRG